MTVTPLIEDCDKTWVLLSRVYDVCHNVSTRNKRRSDMPTLTRLQAICATAVVGFLVLPAGSPGTAEICKELPGQPGEFHPELPTDPDVNLSIHPARATQKKAAAFHQDTEFLRVPVDSVLTWVTCPLRSTGITPLPGYYGAVRPWPMHQYFWPRGFSTCAFSLCITDPVLKFRTKARIRVMPPIHRTPA